MRRLVAASIAGVIALSARSARAETLPTFFPDVHALKATHVIVATEGSTLDGEVEVLESWRGDLRAGDRLKVDGLARLEAGEDARLFGPLDDDFAAKETGRATFRRVVLFLARTATGFGPCYLDLASCVVCVEDGRAYAMVQVINPGPRYLLRNDRPAAAVEAELRALVVHVDDQCRHIADILNDTRPLARVKALEPMCSDFVVGRAAMNGLAGCGKDALPALWRLYRGGAGHPFRPEWMRAIVAVGGRDEAPSIATLLRAETAYWKATAPTLADSWWTPPLYQRYVMLEDLLDALAELGAPVARDDAEALLALADANPRFAHANEGTSSRVRRAAGDYLKATRPPPPESK